MTGKEPKELDRMQREEQQRRAEAAARRDNETPDSNARERVHGAPEPTMKERINDRSK